MRVVVTGAAGFIGSHLCEALVARGHEVVGVDCFTDNYPRQSKERNLAVLFTREHFDFHELDLRSDRLEPAVEGADAVINEAAMPGLVRGWTDFSSYVSCNLIGLQRLIAASQSAGVERFIQASTSSVYGVQAVGDEDLPTRPASPYGVTKLAAEHLLMSYVHQADFPGLVLRYFSIYGPRQRPDMAYHRFIESLTRGNRTITVYGDGSQTRSNTFVADCIDGTLLALDGGRIGETYNIGGGKAIALMEAISLIADYLGVTPSVVFEGRRRGDQLHTQADCSRARDSFGYVPRIHPQEGLALQAAWQVGLDPIRGPDVGSELETDKQCLLHGRAES
jgi:UDP-glucuronate 4-epimerase